jgi:hypothetical protein
MFGLSLLLMLVALPASAQQSQSSNPPILVQQVPTELRACTVSHNDQAVNTLAPVTITPPNGWYVYVCGFDFQAVADGTGGTVQSNVKWTTANLGGLAVEFSFANTANTQVNFAAYYAVPMRAAQPGVAVTFTTPAVSLHTAYSQNVYYYFSQY